MYNFMHTYLHSLYISFSMYYDNLSVLIRNLVLPGLQKAESVSSAFSGPLGVGISEIYSLIVNPLKAPLRTQECYLINQTPSQPGNEAKILLSVS